MRVEIQVLHGHPHTIVVRLGLAFTLGVEPLESVREFDDSGRRALGIWRRELDLAVQLLQARIDDRLPGTSILRAFTASEVGIRPLQLKNAAGFHVDAHELLSIVGVYEKVAAFDGFVHRRRIDGEELDEFSGDQWKIGPRRWLGVADDDAVLGGLEFEPDTGYPGESSCAGF